MTRRIRTLTLGAAAALLLALPVGASAATPTDDGCPASSSLISVAYIESLGDYHVPGRIDDPANGGNGDGWVCGFALPEAVATAWGLAFGNTDAIYVFFENDLRAART